MTRFVTDKAATLIGDAMLNVLDHVSPAYSNTAWYAVAALPALTGFLITDAIDSPNVPTYARESLAYGLFSGLLSVVLAMLVISPIAWLLSAVVSNIRRRRVPESPA